jgi:hypothetical protein
VTCKNVGKSERGGGPCGYHPTPFAYTLTLAFLVTHRYGPIKNVLVNVEVELHISEHLRGT